MRLPVTTIGPTSGKHSATVIFFHGSGDTGANLIEWVRFLLGRDLSFSHVRVVYPTAPLQAYTPNGGAPSNVWFDRRSVNIAALESRKSMSKCYQMVHQLIEDEVNQGTPANRILVGGFSMGGALALHTAYHLRTDVAGVFACSSFLNRDSVVYESLSNRKTSDASTLPELRMFHGERDTLVPLKWGGESYDELQKHGVVGTFTPLPGTLHELKKRELLDLETWILKKLPPLTGDVSNKL